MPGTERRDPHVVLGVRPGSSPAEIRDAYRRLANELHPDRSGDQGADRMAEINDAYRTLRGRGGPSPLRTATPSPPAPPMPMPMPAHRARIPWRAMALFAVLGSVAVVVGAQFVDAPTPAPPDNVLSPGSCVTILANSDAAEVECTGDGDLVVETVVNFDSRCPPATEAHRDRQGMGWACVTGIVRAPEGD